MTNWFYLLLLMVLGFSDGSEKLSQENQLPKHTGVPVHSSKSDPVGEVHPRAVKPVIESRNEDDPHNSDTSHQARRTLLPSALAAEADAKFEHPKPSVTDTLASKLGDLEDGLKNRRHFLEPIIDGKIIGSVGKLFSENVKEAADRERTEREELRMEKLLQKYTEMLNDPKQRAELELKAANSPDFINQTIRRSLSPGSNEPIEKNVAVELSGSNGSNLDGSSGDPKNDHRRQDDHESLGTGAEEVEKSSGSQMHEDPGAFGDQNRRMQTDPSHRKNLIGTVDSRECDEKRSFSEGHLSLASMFNDINKERSKPLIGPNADETIPVNMLPLNINLIFSGLRPSGINLDRNRDLLWKYPKPITFKIQLGLVDD